MIPNKAAFRDAFNLYEKHLRSVGTASFSWETLCDEMIAIANRHANNPLLMDLLVAIHAELERKWMERNMPNGAAPKSLILPSAVAKRLGNP